MAHDPPPAPDRLSNLHRRGTRGRPHPPNPRHRPILPTQLVPCRRTKESHPRRSARSGPYETAQVTQVRALAVGEAFLAGAQDDADPVQRVITAAAVPAGVLLDPAPHVVDHLRGELDDMETVMPTSA